MPPIHTFQTDEERHNYENSFRNEEDRRKFEDKYGVPVGPFSETEDIPGIESTNQFAEKGKGRERRGLRYPARGPRYPPDDGDFPLSESSVSSSSPASNPRMTAPAPPFSFSAPLRTTYDLPVRGAKDAPKTFRGRYTEVQLFLDHYEKLLNKCRVTADREKCESILMYCSVDVQNVIQAMESYEYHRWSRLKRDILRQFDAERVFQKYKPADVERYAARKRMKICHNLTQWRRYSVKYKVIAGGPLRKGHLMREDYNAYFLIGVNRSLRQILENRILQANPYRGEDEQYTVKEIDDAAEWYFRRNKYESLMVRAADLSEDQEEDSDEESDSASSGSAESDSDYEEFRRKKKLRAKKKKIEKKKKVEIKRSNGRETQRFQGNEEEIATLIRKLNAMNLNDPEYAPIYYKVMVMDRSGTAEKCVKPPGIDRGEPSRQQPPSRTGNFKNDGPSSPATFPNSIPIGGPAAGTGDTIGCYGCLGDGHCISECRKVGELVERNVIKFNEETRKLVMKNGAMIRRYPGESLVKAAERISGTDAPRVMLGFLNATEDRQSVVQSFYQAEEAQ
jgi:hypothetical protein